MITNPTQSLSQLHLASYTILDSEPLHDLKGHLINLLTELPHILTGESKTLVTELLSHILFSKKQNGYSGSDLRVALIETNNLLQSQHVEEELKLLLITAVKISECLYSLCDTRTPKTVLQLYNCAWLHHELCKLLFTSPKEISYEKCFGLYLHSLVVHAPRQYEIVSLRSINTENQERMFQQIKQIALKCTNRKPENIIPTLLLRVQAIHITGKLSAIYQTAETCVQKVATRILSYKGTCVTKAFISGRSHSWQAHLQRISGYLINGPLWWRTTNDGYAFFDGDDDPDYQADSQTLSHFRSSTIQDVEQRCERNWKIILDSNVILPTEILRNFDENGDFVSFTNPWDRGSVSLRDNTANNESNRPVDDYSSSSLPPLDNCVSNEPLIAPHTNHSMSMGSSISVNEYLVRSSPASHPLMTSTPVCERNQCSGFTSFASPSSSKSSTPCRVKAIHARTLSSTPCSLKSTCDNQHFQNLENNTDIEENCKIILSDEDEKSDVTQYQSKHANNVAEVIGHSVELKMFDDLHIKLKSKTERITNAEYVQYMNILAKLQVQVLKMKSTLTTQIKQFEKVYYTKHHSQPSRECQPYVELYSKLKSAKCLLSSWKIDL